MDLPELQSLLEMPGAATAVQGLASLVAILALVWFTRRLGLGSDPRILSEEHAKELAEEAICGFEAEAVVVDRAGIGALARDTLGRVLVIRQHGSHFAARQLTSHANVRLNERFLTLATDDRRFGTITLDLGDKAAVWAASLRRLGALPK